MQEKKVTSPPKKKKDNDRKGEREGFFLCVIRMKVKERKVESVRERER